MRSGRGIFQHPTSLSVPVARNDFQIFLCGNRSTVSSRLPIRSGLISHGHNLKKYFPTMPHANEDTESDTVREWVSLYSTKMRMLSQSRSPRGSSRILMDERKKKQPRIGSKSITLKELDMCIGSTEILRVCLFSQKIERHMIFCTKRLTIGTWRRPILHLCTACRKRRRASLISIS